MSYTMDCYTYYDIHKMMLVITGGGAIDIHKDDKKMSTVKDKFDAAVNVIQSLPKNGTFQPSNELLLTFYAYYKQATQGQCHVPKPAFWEVVSKAKWDAWHTIGNMSKEDAMQYYVDELKRIVETMPQTSMVAEFVDTLGSFYEIVDDKSDDDGGGDDEAANACTNLMSDTLLSQGLQAQYADDAENNDSMVMASGFRLVKNTSPKRVTFQEVNGEMSHPGNDDGNDTVPVNGDVNYDNIDDANEDNCVDDTANEIQASSCTGTNSVMPISPPDSDTDEFCDTSDSLPEQAVPVTSISNPSANNDASTSLCSTPTRPGSQITTQAQVHQQHNLISMSPVGHVGRFKHTNYSKLNGSPSMRIPFLLNHDDVPCSISSNVLSDSLCVNVPDEECAEMSLRISNELNVSDQSLHSSPRSLELADERRYDHITSSQDIALHGKGFVTMRGGGDHDGASSSRNTAHEQESRAPTNPSRVFGHSSTRARCAPHIGGGSGGSGDDENLRHHDDIDVSDQIVVALLRLQNDMNSVLLRLESLETLARHRTQLREQEHSKKRCLGSGWWPLNEFNGKSLFFVVVWPFLVHWLFAYVSRKRRHLQT